MQYIFVTARWISGTKYVYCHQRIVYPLTLERELRNWILNFHLREYYFHVCKQGNLPVKYLQIWNGVQIFGVNLFVSSVHAKVAHT